MKKLIFIENDHEEVAKDDSDMLKYNMDEIAKIPNDYLATMRIIPDFHRRLDTAEALSIIFDPNNCICTFSMYVSESYTQILDFLVYAGKNNKEGFIYIDGSGRLPESLTNFGKILDFAADADEVINIVKAFETNYIITFDIGNQSVHRLTVELNVDNDKTFKYEDVNLSELLGITLPDSKSLKELRSKCRRWVGSMTRSDRHTWTTLLESQFVWFPRTVTNRLGVKDVDGWMMCVDQGNEEELTRLFNCIEEYRIEKRLKL